MIARCATRTTTAPPTGSARSALSTRLSTTLSQTDFAATNLSFTRITAPDRGRGCRRSNARRPDGGCDADRAGDFEAGQSRRNDRQNASLRGRCYRGACRVARVLHHSRRSRQALRRRAARGRTGAGKLFQSRRGDGGGVRSTVRDFRCQLTVSHETTDSYFSMGWWIRIS